MRKNIFALLRTFMFAAFVSVLSLSIVSCGSKKGKAVDLGLSVKWASCNVGAESPEDYGSYFAWGETEVKDDYAPFGYKFRTGTGMTLTKYCTENYYGNVDNKTVLDPVDDTATASWGNDWRMPTLDEMKELINECTWSWTTQNGVNGYVVTGPNGNSIFLPAAGRRDRMSKEISGHGWSGDYWSATLGEDNSWNACWLFFSDGTKPGCNTHARYNGFSVRPVKE